MKKPVHSSCRYSPDDHLEFKEGDVICSCCLEPMKYHGIKHGPRSRAASMSGYSSDYHSFECVNIEENWHKFIVGLDLDKRKLTSKKLKSIIDEEISEVRKNRKV